MGVFFEWIMSKSDPDVMLSFSTKKQVNILERFLGFTFHTLNISIISYIAIYVFYYCEGYFRFEQARGSIATHVWGDTVAVSTGKPASRFFSAEDLTFPGLENGNVFVATRMRAMRQRRGICEDMSMPCFSDSDCSEDVGGRCTDNGFCEEPTWCDVEEKSEDYEVDTSNLVVWAKSSIQFFQLKPDHIFSTEHNHPYPEIGFNAFTVRDLLLNTEPAPVRFEEVSELGAALEVQFLWKCNVEREKCKPEVHIKRLDSVFDPENIGFKFKWSETISETERVINYVHGIRFFFRTTGIGRKISIPAIVQNFSLNSSLISLAGLLCDLLMTKVFAGRQKYIARKYEVSPDFSDYLDKLNAKASDEKSRPQIEADLDREYQEKEAEWKAALDEHQS